MNAKATLQGERGPPPYFAGRDAELSAMRQRLDIALSVPDSAVNGLFLVTGIPGIGKTHLAEHFIHQQAENKSVKALVVGTDALASLEGLIGLIGEAMESKDSFVRAAGMDDKVSGVRAGVAGVVSGGFTLDAYRPSLKLTHMLHATKDLPAWRNKVLVLVVDEVQNTDAESASQLRALHEGRHGCPILTIAAGLQHSKSVLSHHGISRMSHRKIGLLSHDETVDAISHGLANLGVNVTEKVAEKLANAAMRFPQHVHGYIEAAICVHKERGEVDSSNSLADILEIGRRSRVEYYLGRMSAVGRADKVYPLVEYMSDRGSEAVTWGKAESIIGSDVVDAAVHHGVLSATEDGVLSFEIPSFRSYMIHRAAMHRELARSEETNRRSERLETSQEQ